MAQRDERRFTVFDRGAIRDGIILTSMRNSMRALSNPTTLLPFTEDEITRATQPGSRFYIEADAIDLWAQAGQQRALFFANQIDPRTANTQFLRLFHARIWLGDPEPLPPTGGSGTVEAPATAGAVFIGSTTVPDPTASTARDAAGVIYQVLVTVVTPGGGVATLSMQSIDGGSNTNPLNGSEFTWVANQPLGAEPTALTVSDPAFTGGFDQETDAEHAIRVQERIRERPAAGNAPHFNAWARRANVGVERAFVYACALNAGTTVFAVTQKRGSGVGPLARIASVGLLSDVVGFVVPPASPVVPTRAFIVATGTNSEPTNMEIQISMSFGTAAGWFDVDPYPLKNDTFENNVVSVTSQVEFTFTSTDPLPGGAASLTGTDAPAMMIWHTERSRFERLKFGSTGSISRSSSTNTVILETAPSDGLIAIGKPISPYTDFKDSIAVSVECYFDEFGPGQVVDLDTDARAVRAFRQPTVSVNFPVEAGDIVISRIIESLGGAAPNANLATINRTTPTLPDNITLGPNQLTLGTLAITPL